MTSMDVDSSTPCGQMRVKHMQKSWYNETEHAENDTSTDSEPIAAAEDITSASNRDALSDRMTIDDSDQSTSIDDSDGDQQSNVQQQKSPVQRPLSAGPSSTHSDYSSDNGNDRRSSVSSNPDRVKKVETDLGVLARREKQIKYGKNTAFYHEFITRIPKDKRDKEHPQTPPKHLKYSRRSFDAMVKMWRKKLHQFGRPDSCATKGADERQLIEEEKATDEEKVTGEEEATGEEQVAEGGGRLCSILWSDIVRNSCAK